MKRYLSLAAVIGSAVTFSSAAGAATFLPGSPNFQVSGNIASGPVSASIGNQGIAAGNFTDNFIFRIDQTGLGSGSISTSAASFLGDVTDIDIFSVSVNGRFATKTLSADGLSEFFSISNVPITFGAVNNIEITGLSRGSGSYGGNATFIPNAMGAVPEPATWAIMLLGFAGIGFGLRYQRRSTKVSFG